MDMESKLTRRCLLRTAGMAMVGARLAHAAEAGQPEPRKIASVRQPEDGGHARRLQSGSDDSRHPRCRIAGHGRQTQLARCGHGSWVQEGSPAVGHEDPGLAGIWDAASRFRSPKAAESVLASIRAAEVLGAAVILAAFFRKDAPDMTEETSYGPIVSMLRKVARPAADAGVAIGLENSLSPADNKKLVDLVGHPAVGVYYDLYNMDVYGHGKEAVGGVELLGKNRICMVHVKNGKLLVEEPGPIDWPAAFRAFQRIGYAGWYVYETAHDSIEDCIRDTKKNNEFLRRQIQL